VSRAVKDGVMQFTSPSAITKFDPEQFGGCNRRWHLRYVVGKEEPQGKGAELGDQVHHEIEHYENTGEDVLSNIARAGKHAVDWVRARVLEGTAHVELPMASLLEIRGVPVKGKIDVLNLSGRHYDDRGEHEDGVPEAHDWKTTAKPELMKRADELVATVQMPMYGVYLAEHLSRLGPTPERVRLSHGYFGTQARWYEKRSSVVPVERLARRWEEVGLTVAQMISVAREPDPLKVDPNWRSCDAWRGCPFRNICTDRPLTEVSAFLTSERSSEIAAAVADATRKEDDPMPSFLDSLKPPTPQGAPAAPPAPPAQLAPVAAAPDTSRLAELRAQLEAEEAKARAAAAPAPKDEIVNLTGKDAQRYAKASGIDDLPPGAGIQTSRSSAVLAGVLPPDAPAPGATGPIAEPIPPETLAAQSPAVQAAAAQVAAQPEAPAAEPAKKRGRPRKTLSTSISPEGQVAVTTTPAPAADTGGELWLFVDTRLVRGLDSQPLEPYLEAMLATLAKQGEVPDVRFAPDGHPYAFGKWKGILAACVKKNPPPAGSYTLHGLPYSDIKQVVLEALEPLCAVLVRS